jgi:orotidine-5'-phosphate decarboxylase
MSMTFTEILRSVQQKQNSLLCVGLDTDPAKIPAAFRNSPDGMVEFNRRIIEVTADLVCAYKVNWRSMNAAVAGRIPACAQAHAAGS